jgi:DegV family protein with EDD domain
MLRIIIDGSADMPEGWAEEYQFDILPIPIHIGDRTYYEGLDLTPELFYQLIEDEDIRSRTAAPSPTRIKAFIEEVSKAGDTVLSINVSGKLSATVSMIQQAATELKDKLSVTVFDSGAGSAVLAFMAREARLREKAGESLDTIIERLKAIRNRFMVVMTLDNLEFARRSGRVGAIQAALTSLLNIKPIIAVQEGAMNMTELVRTRRKSLEKLVSKIKDKFGDEEIKVAVVHSQDQETAKLLKEMIQKTLNTVEIVTTDLSISVAANLGPKTVGIVAIPSKL